MHRRKFYIAIFCLCYVFICTAQDGTLVKRNNYLTLSSMNAYMVPHYKELREIGGFYHGVDLRYSYQTNGDKFWHWAYKYPKVGVGANFGKHQNPGIGLLAAGYVYGTFPVYDFGSFKLDWDVCTGMGWVEGIYSEINPYNIGISTHWNAYLDFNLNTSFDISERTKAFIALGVNHFSNGAGKKPNKGINYVSLRTGLSYRLEEKKADKIVRKDYPALNKKWGFDVRYGRGQLGITNHQELFRVDNLQVLMAKRLSPRHRVGFGLDVIKDYSLVWKQFILDGTHTHELGYLARRLEGKPISLYQGGLLISNEFVMRRLSLVTQVGVLVVHSYNTVPIYERFGIRYRLLEGLFIDMSLRATGNKARDITWGIGYSINRGLD